jgi:hypothetical protein
MGFCEQENEFSGSIKEKLKNLHASSLVGFYSVELLSKISDTREIKSKKKKREKE